MRRTSIGIYSMEGEYVRKLAGYIRKRSKDSLEVKAFTEKEALQVCLEEGGANCVLAEPDAADLCAEYPVWTLFLTEEGTEGPVQGRPCIEKYQSAEQIWKLLLKLGGEHLGGIGVSSVAGTESVFLGIASPVHGCGKTSLGLCMGRFLAEKGRTLFLTLDEFSCLPDILGEQGAEAELSELYYYYSQGALSGTRVQSAVYRWGEVEYLAPTGALEDMYREGHPYEPDFFRKLSGAGGYQYVVFDMGNSLFGKETLLDMCNRLYVPEGDSLESLIRTERFWGWLETFDCSERAVRCRLPREMEEERKDYSRRVFLSEIGAVARRILREDGFLPGEAEAWKECRE